MGIAENKLLEIDYYGARTFINQAKSLYTDLDFKTSADYDLCFYLCITHIEGREAG